MPEPPRNREDYLQEQKLKEAPDSLTDEKNDESKQDLAEHLSELRNRILISIGSLLVIFLICFQFSDQIILLLQKAAPPGASFFQLKPGELFFSTIKVAAFTALIFSIPIVLYQVGMFFAPGLKDKERHILQPILWLSPILLILGIYFAYQFVLPPLLQFLLGFKTGIVETRYGLEHFLNLEISILGLCGICFQLPVLLFILSKAGIVDSRKLFSVWRYVVLFAFIISAVLTPTPDPLTMSILAAAIIALYFLTALLLSVI